MKWACHANGHVVTFRVVDSSWSWSWSDQLITDAAARTLARSFSVLTPGQTPVSYDRVVAISILATVQPLFRTQAPLVEQ